MWPFQPLDILKQHLLHLFSHNLDNIKSFLIIVVKCNLIGRNSVHISDIFDATVKISREFETQESQATYKKHSNLY